MKYPLCFLRRACKCARKLNSRGHTQGEGGIIPALVIVLTHLKCTSDVIAGGNTALQSSIIESQFTAAAQQIVPVQQCNHIAEYRYSKTVQERHAHEHSKPNNRSHAECQGSRELNAYTSRLAAERLAVRGGKTQAPPTAHDPHHNLTPHIMRTPVQTDTFTSPSCS
jgi:hypothetical protein